MQHYMTVPWFNSAEFKNVYKDIFGNYTSVQTKRRALDILTVWKNRSPTLSSGIESTLGLLEVLVPDLENGTDDISSIGANLLRLAYCTALMRFVNHSLDAQQAKHGGSLYQAAKNLNVPDWVIKLRHDTAHGHSLPSIELLRKATLTALKWLQEHYWQPHCERVTDYLVGAKLYKCNTDLLTKLTSFYMMISVCNSATQVKSICDIPHEMKECVILEAKDLFTRFNNRVINMESVTISSLVDSTSRKLIKSLKDDDAGNIIIKTILSQDSLFFSFDVLKLVNDYNNQLDSLVQSYISIWEMMLTFLHTNNLIFDFILNAIQFTNDSSVSKETRKLAALWIKEILQGLHKSVLFFNMTKKLDKSSRIKISKMARTDQKILLHKKYPNEKFGLTLDLTKQVPHQLTRLCYVQKIISNYNPCSGVFIKPLLQLLEPKLSKETVKKLYAISKIICDDNILLPSDLLGETKIYNVSDIKSQTIIDTSSAASSENSDCIITAVEEGMEIDEDMGVWQMAQAHEDWSNCPIGVLPWQVKLVK